MKCPRCSQLLRSTTYEGVAVDHCPKCSGIWLDEGELAPILATRELKFSAEAVASAIATQNLNMPAAETESVEACPKCGKPMLAMNFGANSGVIVDRCTEHGLWFDRGELERIQMIHEHWEPKSRDPEFLRELKPKLGAGESASPQGLTGVVGRLLELLIFRD